MELPLSLSSHTGRWPLFILIREGFQEGPVVLGHLVRVCVGPAGMEKAHRSIQSQEQTVLLNLQLPFLLAGGGRDCGPSHSLAASSP